MLAVCLPLLCVCLLVLLCWLHLDTCTCKALLLPYKNSCFAARTPPLWLFVPAAARTAICFSAHPGCLQTYGRQSLQQPG